MPDRELDLFFEQLVEGRVSRRQVLKRLGAGIDHPLLTAFPEGEYLKGLLLQIA